MNNKKGNFALGLKLGTDLTETKHALANSCEEVERLRDKSKGIRDMFNDIIATAKRGKFSDAEAITDIIEKAHGLGIEYATNEARIDILLAQIETLEEKHAFTSKQIANRKAGLEETANE